MSAESRRRYRFLLLVASALAVPPACALPPLMTPRPVAAAPTPAETRAAILRVLLREDWLIEMDQPAQIEARLSRGSWTMVVEILYGQQVAIHYVSSENLDYQANRAPPRIHPGYNRRTLKLMDDIGRELDLARLGDECPPAAARKPPASSAVH
jgi:hypothetical protein